MKVIIEIGNALMTPVGIMLLVFVTAFLASILWVHTLYDFARTMRQNDYLSPKTRKKLHKQFLKRIGAQIK